MAENPPTSISESGSAVLGPIPTDVQLTSAAQQHLNQTGPWVRFMSILMFIGSGFMILAGVFIMLLGLVGMSSRFGPMGTGALPSGVGILLGPAYILMSLLVYLFPGLFLSRYASAIRRLRLSQSALALEDALKNQKSFWRYVGIMTAIMLITAVLGVLAAVFIAAFMSMRR